MKEKGSKPLYRRLLALLLPYRAKLGCAFVCMVGAGLCAAIPAWLMKNVVDGVLIRKDYAMLNVLVVSLVILFVSRRRLLTAKSI